MTATIDQAFRGGAKPPAEPVGRSKGREPHPARRDASPYLRIRGAYPRKRAERTNVSERGRTGRSRGSGPVHVDRRCFHMFFQLPFYFQFSFFFQATFAPATGIHPVFQRSADAKFGFRLFAPGCASLRLLALVCAPFFSLFVLTSFQ